MRCSPTTTVSNPARQGGPRSSPGQTPFRTGLLKVGMPAAKQGLQDTDPTIAELLKPLGYASAQIGKNHLGDRNEYLPTVHGFDEFYGILYHLNAMEEPYDAGIPQGRRDSWTVSARATSWTPKPPTSTTRPTSALGQGRQADDRRWRSAAAAPEHGPRGQVQHGGRRRRTGAPFTGFHRPLREGRQAVLPLAQLHAHAMSGLTCRRSGRARAASASTPTR